MGNRLAHLAMPRAYPLEVGPVEEEKTAEEVGMTTQCINGEMHITSAFIY